MKIQPELRKKPGVHYALTTDGLELPIVDLTYPAFPVSPTDTEQARMVAAFLAQEPPFAKLPPALRRGLLWFFLRGSVLAPQMGVRTHRREPARPLLMIIAGATMLADLLT